jgi:WD40 repeat protein
MPRHLGLCLLTTWLVPLLGQAVGAPVKPEDPAATKDDQPAALDRHGDPLPELIVARLGTVRWRQPLRDGSGLVRVAISADGKLVASKGDCGFSIWEAATGKRVNWFSHGLQIEAGVFTTDGKTLITVENADDRWPPTASRVKPFLQHWEVGTGRSLRRVQVGTAAGPLGFVLFSPDAKLFAAFDQDGNCCFFDTSSGKPGLQIEPDQAPQYPAMAMSPNNRVLVLIGDKGETCLFEVATGKRLQRAHLGGDRLPAFSFGHDSLAVSPDGTMLVAATSDSVCVWDTSTGKLKREIEGCHGPAVFSADGKYLACGDRKTIRLWEADSLREVRRFEDHHDTIRALTFSVDGRQIVTGQDHSVGLWDVATGKQRNRLPAHHGVVYSVAFARDGKRLASGGDDGTALVWDLATGQPRCRFDSHYYAAVGLAFSPDGMVLVTGDGQPYGGKDSREAQIRCWNLDDGRLLRQFIGHLNSVESLAFTPDGKLLVSGGGDARVRVWDQTTGKRLCQIRGDMGRRVVAFSPDGQEMLVGSTGGTLGVWRAGTEQKLRELGLQGNDRRHVVLAAFLPDGKTIMSEEQGNNKEAARLRFWDRGTGREVRSFGIEGSYPCYGNAPSGHAVSPDGATAVTVADDPGTKTIQVWDTVSGKLLVLLRGHSGMVTSLAFAPDGKTLASGSRDTTVLLWDVPRARLSGLWFLLAGDGGDEAKYAAKALAGHPDGAIPFLKERLLLAAAREAPYARLIAELDNDQFEVREKASLRLEEFGPAAEFALRLALEGRPSVEVTRRVRQALEKLVTAREEKVKRLIAALDGDRPEDALRQIQDLGTSAEPPLRNAFDSFSSGREEKGAKGPSERARLLIGRTLEQLKGPDGSRLPLSAPAVLRSLEVLETMGTREARQLLEGLSKGTPESRVAHEARASIDRLRKRNQSPERK